MGHCQDNAVGGLLCVEHERRAAERGPTNQNQGGREMTAKELIKYLQGEPSAVVFIHDASTDNDLPIGRVEMKYGQPIVLHVKDDGSEL